MLTLVVVASVMVIVRSAAIPPRPDWKSDEDVMRKEISEELEFAVSDRNLQRIYDLFVNSNGVLLPQFVMLKNTTPQPTHRLGVVHKRRLDIDDNAMGFQEHVKTSRGGAKSKRITDKPQLVNPPSDKETAVLKAKAYFLAFLIEYHMQRGKEQEAAALVLMLMDTLEELPFNMGMHM